MEKWNDITGQKFNRLTVLSYAGTNKNREALFRCRCDCGNEIIARGSAVKNGRTKSCGCLQKEKARENLLEYNKSDRYVRPSHKTHGMKNTKLYNIWHRMKARCYYQGYEHYERYGGRGITVCDEWRTDFMSFYGWAMTHGYREGLTIDRINNDGNYEPGNCRWITQQEQSMNKCNTVYVVHDGQRKTLKEWCSERGADYKLAHARYKKGLEFDEWFVPSKYRKSETHNADSSPI